MSDSGGPDVTQELRLPWDDDPDDLYEHAPCGYLTTLPDGTIVKVNQTFLTWTGYTRGELVGHRRFRDLLSSGGQIYHETHYAPLLRMQDEVHEMAFDVVCADGRALPTLVNSMLSRAASGEPRAIRTTVFNATERRGYERELLARPAARRGLRAPGPGAPADRGRPGRRTDRGRGGRGRGPRAGAGLRRRQQQHLPGRPGTRPDRRRWPRPTRPPATGTTCRAPRRGRWPRWPERGDLHVVGSIAEAHEHFPDLAETMRPVRAQHGGAAAADHRAGRRAVERRDAGRAGVQLHRRAQARPTASCGWSGCSASRPVRRWTAPGSTTRAAAARSGPNFLAGDHPGAGRAAPAAAPGPPAGRADRAGDRRLGRACGCRSARPA